VVWHVEITNNCPLKCHNFGKHADPKFASWLIAQTNLAPLSF
jgi:hypothetical protein